MIKLCVSEVKSSINYNKTKFPSHICIYILLKLSLKRNLENVFVKGNPPHFPRTICTEFKKEQKFMRYKQDL